MSSTTSLESDIYSILLRPTFAWLIVDADGLGLVLAIFSLHTDEVGVCSLIEARPNGQHMLIGLIQSLHQLT